MAYKSQPTVTRPANATPYIAGDVVGGAFQFLEFSPAEKSVLFTSCGLRIDVAAIPAGMTSFRLHLYAQSPPSAIADNSPWDLAAADRPFYLGFLDIGSPADLGSTLFVQTDGVNKQILIPQGGGLWCYMVTNGGFTPAGNSETYAPFVHAVSTED